MIKHQITLILLFFSLVGFGQKVFVASNQSDADFLVYETEDASEANWVVMKTEWENQAINGVWFYTDNKGDADIKIYYVTDKAKADKVEAYTDFATGIKFKLD